MCDEGFDSGGDMSLDVGSDLDSDVGGDFGGDLAGDDGADLGGNTDFGGDMATDTGANMNADLGDLGTDLNGDAGNNIINDGMNADTDIGMDEEIGEDLNGNTNSDLDGSIADDNGISDDVGDDNSVDTDVGLSDEATGVPTDDVGEETNDTPTDDIGEETSDTPTDDVSTETADAPTDDTSEEITDTSTDDVGEKTTEAPTDDMGDGATDTPTDDTDEETTDAPTDDVGEETADTPTNDVDEETTDDVLETPTRGYEVERDGARESGERLGYQPDRFADEINDIKDHPKPKPSTNYVDSTNGDRYVTDDQGRVQHMEGVYEGDKGVRDPKAQREAGGDDRESTDHGGHFKPHVAGGYGGDFNLSAMDGNLNQGEYRQMEARLNAEREKGNDVYFQATANYDGDSERPSSYDVSYRIQGQDGELFSGNQRFYNEGKADREGRYTNGATENETNYQQQLISENEQSANNRRLAEQFGAIDD